MASLAVKRSPFGAQRTKPPRPAAKSEIRRNRARADRVIAFIECLTVPSGEGAGGPFLLRPWQKRFIRDIYEPIGLDIRRVVRRAILSIARKNGKTALIAALVLTHLVGPEAIQNGEIYSAANDREQAAQVFKVAAQIVRADAELGALCKITDSTKTIACYGNGSFYRAISAEAGTKHGLNPSFAIFDELAQARNRELYDVIDTSFGARAEPLFVVISTQSNDPEHVLSKLIDDGLGSEDPTIVCHLYAAPEDTPEDRIFDISVQRMANPALGDFRSMEDLQAIARKVQRMPAEEPKYRNLYLNQRVAPVASLIARAEWMACKGEFDFEDGEDVYLALDLSNVHDLTSLVMISARDESRVKAFFWKPETFLADHSKRDFGAAPRGMGKYEVWAQEGHLLTTPGRTVDKEVVALKIAQLSAVFRVLGLAYDRWRIDDLLKAFERAEFEAHKDGEPGDGLRLVPWGQGFKDMAPAIDALEAGVAERTIVHPNNPVLNWNMGNAVAVTDPAGNRKIDKSKVRFRIDGAVALAMAVGLKARDASQAGPSFDEVIDSIAVW